MRGGEPGGSLVVLTDPFMAAHIAPIISAAARNNIPAVYGCLILPEMAACSPTHPTR
jgi:hypothetical protein